MITTIQRCERGNALPPNVVAGNNETKTVLVDRGGEGTEYAARFIQNTGATNVFFAVQTDAANGSYHGILTPSQQLAMPVMGKVTVWGAGVWEVATLEVTRL